MPDATVHRYWLSVIPICIICFLYLCSFFLFVCATNSLIYSTVCLLKANESFCSQIDNNRSLADLEKEIQKESSAWSLYGTLAFAVVACIISPIYGSLSDTKNRKLPIVLTICNAIATGIIITLASLFQGSTTTLFLYILANVLNGFGGGSLILISSCFGYATDSCTTKEQHVQIIAIIEASLNLGVVTGYLLCSFIFELHVQLWYILLVHVVLLVMALLIGLIFLKSRPVASQSTIHLWQKLLRPLVDSRDLIINLRQNSLLTSFIMLLVSLFFYELYRMGSSSISYLYLHRLSFNDAEYAAYFTVEQLASCIALVSLAVLRGKFKINDLYLAIIGLLLSLVGLFLFAFAKNSKMIFGAIPSMMFTVYYPVCLRALIVRLVSDKDKGKAFGFVAFIQNLDIVIGTIACVQIYRTSIDYFIGAVFIFAIITRVLALLIQVICISRRPAFALLTPAIENEEPIVDIQTDADEDDQLIQS